MNISRLLIPNKLLANQDNPDRVFSTEVLAGIYVKDRADIHTTYFSSEQAGTNYLHPRKNYVNANLFAEERRIIVFNRAGVQLLTRTKEDMTLSNTRRLLNLLKRERPSIFMPFSCR